jgi:hypothetical protein
MMLLLGIECSVELVDALVTRAWRPILSGYVSLDARLGKPFLFAVAHVSVEEEQEEFDARTLTEAGSVRPTWSKAVPRELDSDLAGLEATASTPVWAWLGSA